MNLPDIQETKVSYGKKINKVGVREAYTKVKFNGEEITAKLSCYVSLINNKGIHMSRLLETINKKVWDLTTTSDVSKLLDALKESNESFSEDWFVKFGFDFMKQHISPVSKRDGYIKYDVKLSCRKDNDGCKYYVEVFAPYTSLCPCSKEISKYGAHNQRSEARIIVELKHDNILDTVNNIIDIVRSSGSCEIYSVLKRPDEKFVTERAYENPKFVEDMIREVETKLNLLLDNTINDYSIIVENFESIHQHNALAITNAGRNLK